MEVKLVAGPDAADTFVLARGAARREKERVMPQRFVERLETAQHQLRVAADKWPPPRSGGRHL